MNTQIVRNWMTPNPITITPQTTLPEAKWVPGITRAMIILFIPLVVLALIFQDGGNGIVGLRTLFPAWLIIIAWVVLVVFGISEEG